MKIYGANLSPFVRKVLAVCSIKGLEYEHAVVMGGTRTPEYVGMSALGKVRAMEDGDLSISDSNVICEYLEEKYPEIPVLPESLADRARSRWLEEFGDSKFVECMGPFFFEHFVKKLMGMGEPDLERLEKLAAEDIPVQLTYVESKVPEEGFLFASIGIADIALCSPLITAGYGGYKLDADRYPKTAAFQDRVSTHPAITPVLAREAEMLKSMLG